MKKLIFLFMMLFAFAQVAVAAININTATQEELESIKGIGPVKAKAIIDYRNQNGRFKSIDEVDNVKGVGKGTLDKLRDHVTLTGASSPLKSESGNANKNKTDDAKPASRSRSAGEMPESKPVADARPQDMKPRDVEDKGAVKPTDEMKKGGKKSRADEKAETASKTEAADKKEAGDKKAKSDSKKKDKAPQAEEKSAKASKSVATDKKDTDMKKDKKSKKNEKDGKDK